MQTSTLDPALDAALPCGARAARALCQRVASLRAALDAVCASLPTEDALQAPVCGARTELDRFARDVQALIDWSLPSVVRREECSLEEIGFAAVNALASDRRSRTVVSVESPATRVVVDGSIAAKSLSRLLEHGFACGAGHAGLQLEPRGAGFSACASFDGVGEMDVSLAASLAEAVARRDLARLGASIDVHAREHRTVVEFPAPCIADGGAQ